MDLSYRWNINSEHSFWKIKGEIQKRLEQKVEKNAH